MNELNTKIAQQIAT